MTENWIAERHKREEVEAALRAARQHIAKLERQANKVAVTVSVDDCGRSVIAALRDYNKRFGPTGVK